QAAIQWSYDLLTPPEQQLFQRLSVFTSTFDLTAAEAVSTDESVDDIDVDRLLGSLIDQSMLTIESGPFGRLFRFLEPIHDFGIDRLAESGHADDVATRHTKWCLSQVTEIGRKLAGWDEIQAVAQLEELWPNLRTAFDRVCSNHDRHLARQLVRPILGEIVLRGHHEIGDWVERILTITPPHDQDTIVFGLYWAAHRYTISQNLDGYQQLIERYGEPDHVLIKHGRAFVAGNYEAQAEWSAEAGAELHRLGDHHLAERTDINIASALLNLGRYEEQEALAQRLVTRYRDQGPPTYLNWSLMQLGYNALFQGQPDKAEAYFNQAIEIEVPPRTHSPNRPLEARRAFRNREHGRAYRILRACIDDILTTDNIQAGLLVCIEFTNMMASIDRPHDAARILGYLETTGLLDTPAWRTLIADAAATLASTTHDTETHPGPDLDHHQALQYMATVLDQLTAAIEATT
ncbi:MAG: tetratricopeptide repeat protein, partial [Acidimicrobiia bacterium]|nr:tetratricopeptide repeat protein [Acidimicrobiia bacterium]